MSYKRCKSCSAPLLKVGQVRKHPDDYQHASGCPEGPARVLTADPPWQPRDKLPGPTRGAARNYQTMSVDQIMAFSLPEMERDCWLFLWRLASMPEEALAVVRAWGFVPKSEIVWRKTRTSGKLHFGMGRTVRMSHEICIIATRGRPQRKSASIRSIFDAPVGRHSEKPDAFFGIIESLCGGPYIELFSRRQRDGWTCIGDELQTGHGSLLGMQE